ncbi:hypothetical protein Psta_0501 [Pirellula staleyi DSM 6068]|uniref:Uncharacterized protein n=1 Tax=Pirellula staleyi (strain ATCC 27377 / DSM 6068 / ICPB 4128) TaxID=530564 RepID=D2R3F8_PIRSD|nr:hypothetical protein [Pirellula staleyi]ADB15189.1 hypothetical protein Psta_0501 [Pirellula staleyi DSM 6068]
MSNPYLKPDDPRFQPKSPHDAAGNNLFADNEIVSAQLADGSAPSTAGSSTSSGNSTPDNSNLFAASPAGSSLPFQPTYIAVGKPRIRMLVVLVGIGIFTGVIAPTLYFNGNNIGWGTMILGLPTTVTAIFIGYSDLRAMQLGAMHNDRIGIVRLIFYFAVAFTIIIALEIAGLIFAGMQFAPFLDV